jgi:hypothetical protein
VDPDPRGPKNADPVDSEHCSQYYAAFGTFLTGPLGVYFRQKLMKLKMFLTFRYWHYALPAEKLIIFDIIDLLKPPPFLGRTSSAVPVTHLKIAPAL